MKENVSLLCSESASRSNIKSVFGERHILRAPHEELNKKHLKSQHICALEPEAETCTKEAMVY